MSQGGKQYGTHSERLVTIEVRLDENARAHEHLNKKLDKHGDKIDGVRTDVSEIKSALRGMQGFGKGVVFAFSAIAAMVGSAVAALWQKIFDGGA